MPCPPRNVFGNPRNCGKSLISLKEIMIQNSIPRALSTFLEYRIKSLLIGGQACILYGAAEFSRDIDLAVMVSSENLDNLRRALEKLNAERIFFPDISEDVLLNGHACHFRCRREDVKGLRVDIISIMRDVAPFNELWERREEIGLSGVGKIAVIGLSDLVRTKKIQRDKDWPMIRRLIESDIFNASNNPSRRKICFWLTECRTPELLISLAAEHPDLTSNMLQDRPLLRYAIDANSEEIQRLLKDEEDKERDLDRQYWKPLKAELEAWCHKARKEQKINKSL